MRWDSCSQQRLEGRELADVVWSEGVAGRRGGRKDIQELKSASLKSNITLHAHQHPQEPSAARA